MSALPMPDYVKTSQASAAPAVGQRVTVGGKFFCCGTEKFMPRGVSYGPFCPNAQGEPFPESSRLSQDLTHLRELGFNTVRLYHPPSDQLLSEALRLELQLIVGLPWTDHGDFLSLRLQRQAIIAQIQTEVARLKDHSCVMAFFVGNELEKTLVRWLGPSQVQRFLEQLITAGRRAAPNKLFSYANYPSTEYLIPRNVDFLAFNVYLEQRADFSTYLQRLHHLAGNKPLLISELGLDTATHGAGKQALTRSWYEAECAQAAVGHVWFSYTDEWFRDGVEVTDWQFGLLDRERRVRPAAWVTAETMELPCPFISVIVCTYNGMGTLRDCLSSLQKLRYPSYEILVIDDGSTLDIASIAAGFPEVRLIRQEHAGLSVARNLGALEARGEILAYTDDDCLADADWLTHLAAGFDQAEWVACGGPNIPPPPRNATERIVAAAPGAPAHVMLNDAEAEHLPGCNLAIRKSALMAIGGFRAHYQVAGDDVDICWRLRERGGRLRFLPGAMVWHHRRRTLGAYLRQQRGYGAAEALLMKDHPQHFGPLGGARWSGAIYGDVYPVQDLTEGRIFYGPRGHGLFQGIYQSGTRGWLDWLSGTLWMAMVAVAVLLGWYTLTFALFSISLLAALDRHRRLPYAPHPLSWHGHLKLIALCWVQPIIRESARLKGMITLGARPGWQPKMRQIFTTPLRQPWQVCLGEWAFESSASFDREVLLKDFREQYPGPVQEADGWQRLDLILPSRIGLTTALLTVTEYHSQGRRVTRVRALLQLRLFMLLLGAVMLWLHLLAGSLVILSLLLYLRTQMQLRLTRCALGHEGVTKLQR